MSGQSKLRLGVELDDGIAKSIAKTIADSTSEQLSKGIQQGIKNADVGSAIGKANFDGLTKGLSDALSKAFSGADFGGFKADWIKNISDSISNIDTTKLNSLIESFEKIKVAIGDRIIETNLSDIFGFNTANISSIEQTIKSFSQSASKLDGIFETIKGSGTDIKERIENVNESITRLTAGLGAIGSKTNTSAEILIEELTKISELVNAINSKDFTITNFFKNTVDDSQQFERRLQVFKELSGVIRQVQEAYASMNAYARDAVLAPGESKTVMDMLQYSPRNADTLNRTSVVAGITAMTDLIDTAIPIIEKYNAAIAEIGHGRIPELQMPDMSRVQNAREELDKLTHTASTFRETAKNVAGGEGEMTNAVTATQDIASVASALPQSLRETTSVLDNIDSRIKEVFSFKDALQAIDELKAQLDRISGSLGNVTEQYQSLQRVRFNADEKATIATEADLTKAMRSQIAGPYESFIKGKNIDFSSADVQELTARYAALITAINEVNAAHKTSGSVGMEQISSLQKQADEVRILISLLQEEASASAQINTAKSQTVSDAEQEIAAQERLKNTLQSLRDMRAELGGGKTDEIKQLADVEAQTRLLENVQTIQQTINRTIVSGMHGNTIDTTQIQGMIDALNQEIALEQRLAAEAQQTAETQAEAAQRAADEQAKAAQKAEAEMNKHLLAPELASARSTYKKIVQERDSGLFNTDEAKQKLSEILELYRQFETEAAKAKPASGATDEVTSNILSKRAEFMAAVAALREMAAAHDENAGAAERDSASNDRFTRQVSSLRDKIQKQLDTNLAFSASQYGRSAQGILNELNAGNVDPSRFEQLKAEVDNIMRSFQNASSATNGFFGTITTGMRSIAGFAVMRTIFMKITQAIKKMVSAVKEVDAAMTELRKVTDMTSSAYTEFYNQAVQSATKTGSTISDTINATADFARLGYNPNEALQLAEAALVYRHVGDGITDVEQATESLISTIKAFGMEAGDAMTIVDEFNEVGNNFAISSTGIGEALVRSASALQGAGNTLEESIGLITASNAIIQNPESVGTALKTLTMYLRAAKPDLEAMGEDTEDCANSVAELREKLLGLTGVDIMKNAKEFKSTYDILQEISKVWGNMADVDRAAVTKLIGGKRNANVIQALLTNFSDAEKAATTAANSAGSALAENEEYMDSIAGKLDILHGKFEAMSQAIVESDVVKLAVDLLSVLTNIGTWFGKLPGYIKYTLLMVAAVAEFGKILNLIVPLIGRAFTNLAPANLLATLKTPLNGILVGLTGIVSIIGTIVSHAKQARAEALQAANDTLEKTRDAKASYEENIAAIDKLKARYEELSQGVGQNGENLRLTSAEYEEYKSIVQQLVDISPSIVTGYNDQREALIDLKNAIQEAKDAQQGMYDSTMGEAIANINKDAKAWSRELYEADREIGKSYGVLNDLLDVGDSRVTRNERIDAIMNALSYAGVIPEDELEAEKEYAKTLGHIELSVDQLKKLYANIGTFREAISGATFESTNAKGENALFPTFSSEDVDATIRVIQGLEGAYNKASKAEDKYLERLWSIQEYNDHIYGDAPWADYVKDLAAEEITVEKASRGQTWDEKTDADLEMIRRWGEAFKQAYEEESVEAMEGARQALLNGDISKDEYAKKWDDFKKSMSDTFDDTVKYGEFGDVIQEQLILRFMGLEATVAEAGTAIGSTSEVIQRSLSNASDAIENFQSAQDLMNKATKEMIKNGGLTASTFKSMLKTLPEDANIADYFTVDEGKIKANAEAWRELTSSFLEVPIDDINKQVEKLEDAKEQLISTAYGRMLQLKGLTSDGEVNQDILRQAIVNLFGFSEEDADQLGYLIDRAVLHGTDMIEAGWEDFLGSEEDIVTYYSQAFNAGIGQDFALDENVVFSVTPIDKDGNVLDEAGLNDYLYTTLFDGTAKTMEEVLARDRDLENGGRGLILHVTPVIDVDDKGWEDAIAKEVDFDNALHNLSAIYSDPKIAEDSRYIAFGLYSTLAGALRDPSLLDEALDSVYDVLEGVAKVLGSDNENPLAQAFANSVLGADIEGIKASASDVEKLEALKSIVEMYTQLLTQSDDPFGLKSMFESIDQTKNDASDLVSALEEIKNVGVANMAELASKHPDLMESVLLPFGVDDLDSAKSVLESELAKYEVEYQTIVQGYIDSIGQMIEEAEPGEGTTKLEVLKANLEGLLGIDFSSLVTGANDFSKLTDAMSKAGNYADMVRDAYDGIDFDFISKMMSTFGADWMKYMKTDADGNFLGIDDQALYHLISAELDLEGENAHLKASFDAMWEAAKKGEDVKSQFDKLTEAMSKAENVASLLADAQNLNGRPIESLIQQVQSVFGDKWKEYFAWDDLGQITGFLADKALESVDEVFTNAEAPEAVRTWWQQYLGDTLNGVDAAQSALQRLSAAISDVNDAQSMMISMGAPGARVIDNLGQIINFAEKNKIDIGELITFEEGDMRLNQERLSQYIQEMTSPVGLMRKYGLTMDQAISISVQLRGALEAKAALENLSNAISQVSTAADLLANVRAADGDFVSMFQTAMQMANATGQSLSEFLTIIGDRASWNEDAIINWANAYVDGIEEINGATPEMIYFLKQSVRESITANTAYNAASDGVNNVANAIKSSVSELGLSNEEIRQLTARYSELEDFEPDRLFKKTGLGIHLSTEALREYESAFQRMENEARKGRIEELAYQYEELSQQIRDADNETKFSELFNQRAAIGKEIDSLQILQAQYDALTSRYNKWKQAQSGGEEGDMYDDIAGSLENIDDIYKKGKIGTNEFKSFLELATGKDTSGKSNDELIRMYEEAYPKMQKYFTDSEKGSKALLTDLEKVSNGEWAHQDGNGVWQLDFNIEEAAEKLGISSDALEIALRKLKDYNFDINFEELGISDHVGDIETALDEVGKARAKLEEDFANGKIDSWEEYFGKKEELDQFEERLRALQAERQKLIEGGTESDEPLTLDSAIEEIANLKSLIAEFDTLGIEIPVTLSGDTEALDKLLGTLGENDTDGNLTFTVETPEDAAQKILKIKEAMDAVEQSSSLNPQLKATLLLLGNMTIAELQELAGTTFPEYRSYQITITANDEASATIRGVDESAEHDGPTHYVKTETTGNAESDIVAVDEKAAKAGPEHKVEMTANDQASPVIDEVDAKAGKDRPTSTIEMRAHDVDVSDTLDAFENDPHDASVNVSDNGTTEPIEEKLERIGETEYPAAIDADDHGSADEVEQNLNALNTEHPAPVNADDNGTIDEIGEELDGVTQDNNAVVGFEPDRDSMSELFKRKQEAEEDIVIHYSFEGPEEAPEETPSSIINADEMEEAIEEAVEDADASLLVEAEIDTQSLQDDLSLGSITVPITFDTLNAIDDGIDQITWDAFDAGVSTEQIDLLRIAYEQLSAAMSEVRGAGADDTTGNAEKAATDLKTAAQNFTTQMDLLSQTAPDLKIDADFSEAVAAIADLALPESEVKFNPETGEVEAYVPADKSASVNYKPDFTKVISATVPTLRGIVEYTRKFVGSTNEGPGLATGTAHAEGNAFKNGKGGLKHDVDALGGEVGPELVVRNGRYFTIGNDGAEFFRFKSGDIIFNASQTKELLKYGRIRSNGGRGKVIGDGSAYADGSAYPTGSSLLQSKLGVDGSGSLPSTTSSSRGTKGNKGKSGNNKGNNKDKKSDKEKFDWIEVLIDRIEAKIKKLARIAESTFKTLAQRTSAINDEISKVDKEIEKQNLAAKRYKKEADKVKLSEGLKKKVRNGTIDITKYKGKTLERINEYQEWYEKSLAAEDRATELIEERSQLFQDRFEMIQNNFENQLDQINHRLEMFDKTVSMSEYSGQDKPFNEMMAARRESISVLELEAIELEKQLEIAVSSGKIAEGSEAWYGMKDAIASAKEEAADARIELAKLYKDAFDDIERRYDNIVGTIEAHTDSLQRQLDMLEARSYIGGSDIYRSMIDDEYQKISAKEKELAELRQKLNDAVASGEIKEGSDAWYEMQSQIDGVTASIDESKISVVEYEKAMRQISWDMFDFAEERISAVTDEANFLIQMLEKSGLFDDKGQFTNAGIATIGMHSQNYDTYMRQADDYSEEIKRINADLANDPANTELIRRREELIKLQRDSILAAEDEKQAVADLVEEGIQKQLDHMKELIDNYTDLLDREKDAYSYQKNIAKQTKEITSLQKQLSAFSGDTSEENRARIQKLQVSLNESMDELAETQYDQFISDTKRLLDDLYSDSERVLNERLDNIDNLFEQMINQTNNSAILIEQTIRTEMNRVGMTMSDAMTHIWSNDGSGKHVVSIYGTGESKARLTDYPIVHGFAAGGFVADMQKAAFRNGDKMITVNTLKPGEGILTPDQATRFKTLVDSLPGLQGAVDAARQLATLNTTVGNMNRNVNVDGINVKIQIDHVQDYNDFVRHLRDDKTFERMIKSFTVDPLTGGSSLAKKKYYH